MWTTLADTLAYAIALAISPFAITTAIVLLLGDRGPLRASLFGVGWWTTLFAITMLSWWLVDSADEENPQDTADGISIGKLVFAGLFFLLAAIAWLKRRKGGPDGAQAPAEYLETEFGVPTASAKPGLLDRLDGVSVLGCFGLGLAQGVIVFKNIPLGISAGATLGTEDLNIPETFLAAAIFTLIASIGVIVPVTVALVAGDRVIGPLRRAREWIEAHLTPISIVLFAVLGVYYLYEGIESVL